MSLLGVARGREGHQVGVSTGTWVGIFPLCSAPHDWEQAVLLPLCHAPFPM